MSKETDRQADVAAYFEDLDSLQMQARKSAADLIANYAGGQGHYEQLLASEDPLAMGKMGDEGFVPRAASIGGMVDEAAFTEEQEEALDTKLGDL